MQMRDSLTRAWSVLLVGVILVIVVFGLIQLSIFPVPWTHDQAQVTVSDDDETKLVAGVEVADTWAERHTGLSEHDSLDPETGMLFVHGSEDERTYVMRDMDFDIDIIFVGADREITTIHHARAPEPGEDGEDLRYTGEAKWVLEVPAGTVNDTDIEVGDRVEIENLE